MKKQYFLLLSLALLPLSSCGENITIDLTLPSSLTTSRPYRLQPTVAGSDTAPVYEVSPSTIAEVQDGKLIPLASGSATLKVTVESKSEEYSFAVIDPTVSSENTAVNNNFKVEIASFNADGVLDYTTVVTSYTDGFTMEITPSATKYPDQSFQSMEGYYDDERNMTGIVLKESDGTYYYPSSVALGKTPSEMRSMFDVEEKLKSINWTLTGTSYSDDTYQDTFTAASATILKASFQEDQEASVPEKTTAVFSGQILTSSEVLYSDGTRETYAFSDIGKTSMGHSVPEYRDI